MKITVDEKQETLAAIDFSKLKIQNRLLNLIHT